MALGAGEDFGAEGMASSSAASAAMGPASAALAGAGLVGGIASGIMSNSASVKAQKRQLEFADYVNRNKYQMATADLEKAGLNPMLAYTQGAGSMQGGVGGQGVDPTGGAVEKGIHGLSSAAAIENVHAQTQKTESETQLNHVLAQKAAQDTRTGVASAGHLEAQTGQAKELTFKVGFEIAALREQMDYLVSQTRLNDEERHRLQQLHAGVKALTEAQAYLHQLEIPRGKAEAAMHGSNFGQGLPYLIPFGKAVGSAIGLRALTR